MDLVLAQEAWDLDLALEAWEDLDMDLDLEAWAVEWAGQALSRDNLCLNKLSIL